MENDKENKWTEWGECKSGFQEREKCELSNCILDTKKCTSADDKSVWTEWGSCGDDGRQARLGWNLDPEFTVIDDRPCDDEGDWGVLSDEVVLDFEDMNDYWMNDNWEFDDVYGSDLEWMDSEAGSWVAYSL